MEGRVEGGGEGRVSEGSKGAAVVRPGPVSKKLKEVVDEGSLLRALVELDTGVDRSPAAGDAGVPEEHAVEGVPMLRAEGRQVHLIGFLLTSKWHGIRILRGWSCKLHCTSSIYFGVV